MFQLLQSTSLSSLCFQISNLHPSNSGGEAQRSALVKSEQGSFDTLALFTSGDTISGQVHLTPVPGKKVEHLVGAVAQAVSVVSKPPRSQRLTKTASMNYPRFQAPKRSRFQRLKNRSIMKYPDFKSAGVQLGSFKSATTTRPRPTTWV